jgi:hypothetical protein
MFTLAWLVPKNKVHPQYEFVLSGQPKRKTTKVTIECRQWHDQSGAVNEVQRDLFCKYVVRLCEKKSIKGKGREERGSAPLNDDGSEKRRTSGRNDASATVPSSGRDCLDVNDMASDQFVFMQQDRGNVNVLAVFLAAKLERSTLPGTSTFQEVDWVALHTLSEYVLPHFGNGSGPGPEQEVGLADAAAVWSRGNRLNLANGDNLALLVSDDNGTAAAVQFKDGTNGGAEHYHNGAQLLKAAGVASLDGIGRKTVQSSLGLTTALCSVARSEGAACVVLLSGLCVGRMSGRATGLLCGGWSPTDPVTSLPFSDLAKAIVAMASRHPFLVLVAGCCHAHKGTLKDNLEGELEAALPSGGQGPEIWLVCSKTKKQRMEVTDLCPLAHLGVIFARDLSYADQSGRPGAAKASQERCARAFAPFGASGKGLGKTGRDTGDVGVFCAQRVQRKGK